MLINLLLDSPPLIPILLEITITMITMIMIILIMEIAVVKIIKLISPIKIIVLISPQDLLNKPQSHIGPPEFPNPHMPASNPGNTNNKKPLDEAKEMSGLPVTDVPMPNLSLID